MWWMIKMNYITSFFLISFIIFSTAFLLFLSFQFIRAIKLELKYDKNAFLHARKKRKKFKLTFILSIITDMFWTCNILLNWVGLWSVFLLLFGFSIPIFFFTGYYSHNTYYKKWHNFYLENSLKKWDENHKK